MCETEDVLYYCDSGRYKLGIGAKPCDKAIVVKTVLISGSVYKEFEPCSDLVCEIEVQQKANMGAFSVIVNGKLISITICSKSHADGGVSYSKTSVRH